MPAEPIELQFQLSEIPTITPGINKSVLVNRRIVISLDLNFYPEKPHNCPMFSMGNCMVETRPNWLYLDLEGFVPSNGGKNEWKKGEHPLFYCRLESPGIRTESPEKKPKNCARGSLRVQMTSSVYGAGCRVISMYALTSSS